MVIGVVGYRGVVGQMIVSLLEKKYVLLKGGRYRDTCEKDVFYVDAYDTDSVKAFCKKCRILINAAGPSYMLEDRIASIACSERVKYVDIFGGNLLLKKILPYAREGRFVICAGSVPGLSGLLVKYILEKHLAGRKEISLFQGGRESGGCAGLSDIILSMASDYGQPGKVIHLGEIIQDQHNLSEKVLVNGFPEPVFINAFLTSELKSIAKGQKDLCLSSYQMFPDKGSMQLLMEGAAYYISNKRQARKPEYFRNICDRQKSLIADKSKWYVLLLEAKSESKKIRILIRDTDSTLLTALVATLCAEQLVHEKDVCGISWGFETADTGQMMRCLEQRKLLAEYTEQDLSLPEIVEGEI